MERNNPVQSEIQKDGLRIKFNEFYYQASIVKLPTILQKKLDNADYKEKFDSFERSNEGVFSLDSISNFQNEYLRANFVLNCDEIKTQTILGKKISYKKDDFNHAFLSKNWSGLDFSQKYTILHWLQSTLSTNHNQLPSINFISPDFNMVGNVNDSYNYKTKSIYLNPSFLDSGLNIASALIHEMDHYKNFLNLDVNSIVQINNKEENLKKYLRKKYNEKIIDIDLSQVDKSDWNSVLFYKNILSPITRTGTKINDVDSIDAFIKYMQNELYYFSPIEKKAYAEESRQLNIMFADQVRGYDRLMLNKINRHTNKIESLSYAPVLKRLGEDSSNELLNATMQANYYSRHDDLYKSPECDKYEHENNKNFNNIYNYLKNEDGELSLER